jgi:hypothetical protein
MFIEAVGLSLATAEGGETEMAYTPELSMKSSSTLRRIAWTLDMPMTKAIEKVFEYLPKILVRKKVCQGCRDRRKCSGCAFVFHDQNEKEMCYRVRY